MGCLPCFLADASVGAAGKDVGIGPPKVAERSASAGGFGDSFPERPAGRLVTVTVDKGDDLSGPAAQGRPRPYLVVPLLDVTTDFIQFQDVIRADVGQAGLHFGQVLEFFSAKR